MHADVKAGGGLLSEYSVGDPERRRLKLKHVWLVCASTDDGRSLTGSTGGTGGTNLIGAVVDCVASSSGPCINGRLLQDALHLH